MGRPELPIAIVAAAALLAGCGGGGSTSGGSSSSASASAGDATSAERSTTSAATRSTASTHSTSTSAATTTVRTTTQATKPPKSPKSPKSRPSPATPVATVDAALTSPRCDLYTARLLQKSYGGLAGCEAALGSGGRAKSVEIERSQPEGKFALVVAVPHGGPSSGEKLAVSLVRANGSWRLDAIHSNVKVGP